MLLACLRSHPMLLVKCECDHITQLQNSLKALHFPEYPSEALGLLQDPLHKWTMQFVTSLSITPSPRPCPHCLFSTQPSSGCLIQSLIPSTILIQHCYVPDTTLGTRNVVVETTENKIRFLHSWSFHCNRRGQTIEK